MKNIILKLNTLVVLASMLTLAFTENGICKIICWGILFLNIMVYGIIFEKDMR